MDRTQTSEPTEAGPGFPGQAAAARRALDETAATEGPLDLTVPLNIAEIRAALATTGPRARATSAASAAPAFASTSAASARPQESRAGGRHSGPRRLGRIAAFVAVAAALSVGTAGALVLSSDGSASQSVSLPASGAIPVAPSTNSAHGGAHPLGTGSTSASAAPSLSRSTADVDPVAVSRTTGPAGASSTAGTTGSSASATASGTDPAASISPPDAPIASSADWQTLYQGEYGTTARKQETTDVQSLLDTIGYLQPWRRRMYVLPEYSLYAAAPDPTGYYGSATADAIAEFQQNYSVGYTTLGQCDLATYDALVQVTDATATSSGSNASTQAVANQTAQ
ncbi:peptidoglycan-binding protein [Actinospica sp. MGRD01-02]|uniref:Peptidoglycan-binding protein n=1 Tax=Actinospica acidithermotolerans TaxID=2828514 RepID=A0A941EJA5_9ACTN|nr:peptidoglycan-binding protein [Actinospica acidithermotolerans]MBR7828664.1 peptidoglycan-binding protein [Actinospica acidithermotolerans]